MAEPSPFDPPRRRRPASTRVPVAERPAPKISILLADDHALVRQGMRVLLEAEDDIEVVAEAKDGRQAAEMAARLRPDVIVMDIAMPMLNGIEATRQILDAEPTMRVLVLSAHSDDEYVDRVMRLGAVGYLLKQSSFADLAAAIRTVRAGETYFSPSISRRLQRRLGGTPGEPGGRSSGARSPTRVRLTSRETEVLQLVAEGKANKQTAKELGISIKTVEKHRQSLMRKIDIHDVAGLTRYAIEAGIIEGRDRGET